MNQYGSSPDPSRPEHNSDNNDRNQEFSYGNPYDGNSYRQEPYRQNPYRQPQRYREPGSSGMALASVILGICSFVFMLSGLSPVLGGIGILLALLSRGCGKMSSTAKAGLIASCCGLIIGTVILGAVTFTLLTNFSAQDYDNLLEQYYSEYGSGHDDSDSYGSDGFPDGSGDTYPDEGDGYPYFFGGEWYGNDSGQPETSGNGGLI